MGRRKTHEQFVAELAQKQPSITAVDEYVDSKSKIHFRCNVCGTVWLATPALVLHRSGCPNYRNHPNYRDPKTKDPDDFAEQVAKLHPTISVLEAYKGSKVKLLCRCNVCGNEWRSTPNYLLTGRGCQICGYRSSAELRSKSQEDFVQELQQVNPLIEVLGEYKNTMTKILVRCSKCGHEWYGLPLHLLRNVGCPKCKGGISFTHAEFVDELSACNPTIRVLENYTNSKTPILCECLDCAFQWKAQPGHLLKGHGCPRCASTGTSKAEQYIFSFFEALLGPENVINRCRSVIDGEIDIFFPNAGFAIEYGSWYWHSNRVSTDISKERACKRKGISLLTVYDSFDPTYEGSLPNNSRVFKEDLWSEENHICLNQLIIDTAKHLGISEIDEASFKEAEAIAVKRVRKKSEADFVDELEKKNPRVIFIGPYTGSQNKVRVRCKKCGHEWEGRPTHLLRGHGCRKCANKTISQKRKKTNAQFLLDLEEKRPMIEAMEEYAGSESPILFKCKECQTVWKTTPEYVFQGQRCPNWRNHAN